MQDSERAQEAKCGLCGEPMPEGEEMFKFHGYSGGCPKPPPRDCREVEAEAMTEPQTDPWAQAEQIVRAHEEVCAGTEPEAPWCCCAPDGTPLCPACKCLADKIAAALAEVCAQVETLTAERDELWGANHLNANALRLAKEGQATLRAQVDRIKELLLQTAAPTAADGSWDSVSAVQWLIEQHDASLATVEPEPEPPTTCRCLDCEPLADPGPKPSEDDINRLEKAAWDSKTDRVLVWYRDRAEMFRQRLRETERAWQLDRKKPTVEPEPCVWREKYNELLFAVERAYPGESRHETALRYIREKETVESCAPKAPLKVEREP